MGCGVSTIEHHAQYQQKDGTHSKPKVLLEMSEDNGYRPVYEAGSRYTGPSIVQEDTHKRPASNEPLNPIEEPDSQSPDPAMSRYSTQGLVGQHQARPSSSYRPSSSARPQSARSMMDTTGDMMFMRILTAEEFIMRMDETDGAIRHWSQCDDPQLKHIKVKESLGLRGHLQDELLRIQAMMSEEDPSLSGLRNFENEYPAVVQRIRELQRKADAIQIQSIDIGMDTDETTDSDTTSTVLPSIGITQGVTQGAQTSARSGQGHSIGTQSSFPGQTMHTQASGVGNDVVDDDDEAIENRFKPKFRAEEDHVAEDFTNRIVQSRGRLTGDDIDGLLKDHAISMQALRKKQDMEKEKYRQFLEAKKNQRLLNRRGKQDTGQTIASSANPNRPKQGDFFFVDFGNTNKSKKPPPKRNSSGPQSTWFIVDMDGNTSSEDTNKDKDLPKTAESDTSSSRPVAVVPPVINTESSTLQDKDGASSQSNESKDPRFNKQSVADSDEDDENLDTIMKRLDKIFLQLDHQLESSYQKHYTNQFKPDYYEDDFEEDEGNEDEDDGEESDDKEDLKATLKDDLWSTLRDKDGMSKETFQELLGVYRDQEDQRKAIRGSENLKHKSLFLSKLAEKQKKKEAAGDDERSHSDKGSSDDDGAAESSAKSFEKEMEEIREVDEELVKKLLAKRHKMTDAEFQDLVRSHLADVERLRRMRAGQREKLDAKLREKLKMKKNSEDDEKDEGLDRELSILDEKLKDDLKRRGKHLDESDLEELLEHYRRQQELLLKKRKAEKSKTDDKLRRKLEEKARKKKDYQDSDAAPTNDQRPGMDTDDSFFQEIQQLYAQGKLSEEEFSNLLKTYLSKVDKSEKEKRRQELKKHRHERKEADMNTVSTLFQESKEVSNQIKGMRQHQKSIADEKLKKKLQAKKNKKTSVET